VTREAEGVLTRFSADLDQNLFGGPEMAPCGRTSFLTISMRRRLPGRRLLGNRIGIVLLALLLWKARPAWHGLQEPGCIRSAVASASGQCGRHVGGDRARVACARQQAHGRWTSPALISFNRRCSRFNVLRFEDLLWAYKK